VGPAVTIFGSARTDEKDPHYDLTRQTAKRDRQKRFAISPAAEAESCEAANRGAAELGRRVSASISNTAEQRPHDFRISR